jgi:hypothetical protein
MNITLTLNVVRNCLDCRVKPDNDKEDVGFQLKLESNIPGNVIPAKAGIQV